MKHDVICSEGVAPGLVPTGVREQIQPALVLMTP